MAAYIFSLGRWIRYLNCFLIQECLYAVWFRLVLKTHLVFLSHAETLHILMELIFQIRYYAQWLRVVLKKQNVHDLWMVLDRKIWD